MYPNELDEEMSNYTWGEKIYPGYSWGYGWGYGNYSSGHGADYWSNQKDFAPAYNPYSHFEAPYYHYPMKGDGMYVWNHNFRNYWGNEYDTSAPRWALLSQADAPNSTNGTLAQTGS